MERHQPVNGDLVYHEYLKHRTIASRVYRGSLLYPKISKHVKGITLDIGCGLGEFVRYRKGSVGVDINPYNVAFARENGLNVVQMDVDLLPFQDDSFDSVVLDNVLEHIANPLPLSEEISRVIKDNGRLIVGVPGTLGYTMDKTHKKFYSEPELVNFFVNAGYSVDCCFHTPFRSRLMDAKLRQYCVYCVFRR